MLCISFSYKCMDKKIKSNSPYEYFYLIKFNIFCLLKSIPLIISSVVFYLLPIIFVLTTHFLGVNLSSIS